jgi:hypothetical protein
LTAIIVYVVTIVVTFIIFAIFVIAFFCHFAALGRSVVPHVGEEIRRFFVKLLDIS